MGDWRVELVVRGWIYEWIDTLAVEMEFLPMLLFPSPLPPQAASCLLTHLVLVMGR